MRCWGASSRSIPISMALMLRNPGGMRVTPARRSNQQEKTAHFMRLDPKHELADVAVQLQDAQIEAALI